MSGEVSRRERPPWRPERGQRIGIPGTTLSISEWAGFTVVVIFVLLLAALVVF